MTRRYYTREAQEHSAREAELDALVRELDAECRQIEYDNRWIEPAKPEPQLPIRLYTNPVPEARFDAFRSPYERQPWQPTQLPYCPPPRQGARRRGCR